MTVFCIQLMPKGPRDRAVEDWLAVYTGSLTVYVSVTLVYIVITPLLQETGWLAVYTGSLMVCVSVTLLVCDVLSPVLTFDPAWLYHRMSVASVLSSELTFPLSLFSSCLFPGVEPCQLS